MRVLFAPWEGPSHLYPAVPLAWAFYVAGHDVRVACQPALVEAVVHAGLPAVSVGTDYDMAARIKQDPTQLNFSRNAGIEQVLVEMRRSFAMLSGYNDAQVDDLVRFAQRWRPDLVIWDPIMFAAIVAARSVGAPDARILWGPDIFMHRRQTFRPLIEKLPPHLRQNPVLDWLSGVLARYGLQAHEDDVMGRWTIDPCPPSMRLPVECDRIPMRYVAYNGRAVAPDWLLDPPPRPRICLTPGTSAIRLTGADSLPMANAVEALGKVDAEVIIGLTAEHRSMVDKLPANVRPVEYLSFNLLLPTTAAVVHHGGAGTTMAAAVHGVPQLVLPHHVADQNTNAEQIAGTGAAISLPADEADVDAIRDAVTRLLNDPAYGTAAASLRMEIAAQPSPHDVVRTLENALATGVETPR